MSTKLEVLGAIGVSLVLAGCGGGARSASPPHANGDRAGTAVLTSAKFGARVERVMVAENGLMAVVGRGGCVASIRQGTEAAGKFDEMRVRCPKSERLNVWFDGIDKELAAVAVEPLEQDRMDDDDITLPAAQLVMSTGVVLAVTKRADASRLAADVAALGAELASEERPAPGPSTPAGWQLMRVSGPAHALFAGTPTRGLLEAQVSTNGQYLCEFTGSTEDGPLRATKSGFLPAGAAARAIDQVLGPLVASGPNERARAAGGNVAAVGNAGEKRANDASTPAVLERFAPMQDALGDACLPELDKAVLGGSDL